MKFVLALILTAASASARESLTPCQFHLALSGQSPSGDSTGRMVSYHTEGNAAESVCEYGTSADSLTLTARGSSESYYQHFEHHVDLPSLSPSTVYYYRCGSPKEEMGPVYSFTTFPEHSSSVRFAAFGDLGLYNGESTINYLNALSADPSTSLDLLFHVGDVGYADDAFLHYGCYVHFCYESAFDNYMLAMEPTARTTVWQTTPGNHEANLHDPASFLKPLRELRHFANFTAYNARFKMPSAESGGTLSMWHSFNAGPVHFVALDLETGYPGAPEETRYAGLKVGGFGDQMTWLEADLKAASESRAAGTGRPWIVVGGHHPMYSGGSVDPVMQAVIEPLLTKYGVDLFVCGHVHKMERNWPTANGETVFTYDKPGLPTHVMVGGPGNDEMPAGERRSLRGAGGSWNERWGARVRRDAKLSAERWSKKEQEQEEEEESLLVDGTEAEETEVLWEARLKALPEGGSIIAAQDDTNYGIAIVTANATALEWKYVRTTTGEVYDSFVLTK